MSIRLIALAIFLAPFASYGTSNDDVSSLKDTYRPISYRLDKKFKGADRRILESAINLVAARMLDRKIMKCAERNDYRGRGDKDYKKAVNWTLPSREMWPLMQRDVLLEEGFATLNVYYDNDAGNDALGYAYRSNKVIVKYRNFTVGEHRLRPLDPAGTVTGEFRVYVNAAWLSKYRSPDFWAGVIAHEMMHNLGHHHENAENGSFNENYGGFFITEFGLCLETNGSHTRPPNGYGLVGFDHYKL